MNVFVHVLWKLGWNFCHLNTSSKINGPMNPLDKARSSNMQYVNQEISNSSRFAHYNLEI